MQQSLPHALYARNIGRLLAGLLVAGTLLVAGGNGHPRPAFAASSLQPPQVLSVRMEKPDTAYVMFRETNDVGADTSIAGFQYGIYWAIQGSPIEFGHQSVAPAGNGRVHTVTISGLNSNIPYCFAGFAYIFKADINHIGQYFDRQSDNSDAVCSDWSSAGTEQSPLPCGVSGIAVTGANSSIRSYDYTYYCDGSFRFHVTALFDTRPFSNDPADANKHRAFEMMKDGDTQIIVNWTCSADPWGLVDTMFCNQRGDPSVQNPNASFPTPNGPLPLSVRFLSDSDRQQLATALRQAVNAPSGSNPTPFALFAGLTPAAGSAATASLPQAPAAPENYKGARDNGLGLTILLTWDAATGADYYYLTAYSHDGNNPVALGNGAPKLDKSVTQFTVGSGDNAANIQGGVDFKLQACNAGGCSPTLTVTVN
jgi:hypothetical protein